MCTRTLLSLSLSLSPPSPESPEFSRSKPAGSSLVHSVKMAGSRAASTGVNTETSHGDGDGDDIINRGGPHTLPSLREEGEGCEDVEGEGGNDFNELNIEGALTDELKILQDENNSLQQQIEVLTYHRVGLHHVWTRLHLLVYLESHKFKSLFFSPFFSVLW